MEFKDLIEVKKLVVSVNQNRIGEKVEFWLPQMFSLGRWSCCIVMSDCEDQRDFQPFISYLIEINAYWFISVMNGDICIHCQ